MPRDGSITAGDLVGRLEYLHVECSKCDRRGRYRVDRLVEEIGPDGKLRAACRRGQSAVIRHFQSVAEGGGRAIRPER